MAKQIKTKPGDEPVINRDQSLELVANCDQLSENASQAYVSQTDIEHLILNIRGTQVIVDRDLALLYQVETKRLNEQVKRNLERFPDRFRFQLSKEETKELALLDKRKSTVKATIYTQHISQQFQLDIDRHNAQYPAIQIERFNKAHDRFLLIDEEVYHIGASLKDLGKKWFGFSLMKDITVEELLNKI